MNLTETNKQPPVWTLFVRVTHWLVAVFVIVNFFNDTSFWHRFIGYACLGLVLLRIIYGLLITKTASSQFYIPTFGNIKQHLRSIKNPLVSTHVGHNPLGQWAVYTIWTLIVLLALTGWISRTDAYWGEDWPVDLHGYLSDALMLMVVLHVSAIAILSTIQKRNFVKNMITGTNKR